MDAPNNSKIFLKRRPRAYIAFSLKKNCIAMTTSLQLARCTLHKGNGSGDMLGTGERWRSVSCKLSLSNAASHCRFTNLLVCLEGGGVENGSDGAFAGAGFGDAGVGTKRDRGSEGCNCNSRLNNTGELIGSV
jgi:hypothetical protein